MADWRISNGSFKGLTFHVAVPKSDSPFGVISQDITNERRLQISERPLVDGADVEDFGRKPRNFTAEIIFFGTDYVQVLKAFEDKLNEGSSGVLILPDLSEAVNAKYQRHTRKTSSAEGNATMLSVSWIEDRTVQIQASQTTAAAVAQSNLSRGNIAQAIPTIQSQGNFITELSGTAKAYLSGNKLLTSLQNDASSVTNATVTINSVLSLPRLLRQNILSNVTKMNLEIDSLKASVKALLNFSNELNLGLTQSSPTRYNSGLGQVDFVAVDAATTTIVKGADQVIVINDKAAIVQSFPDAKKQLTDLANAVTATNKELESLTQGSTSDLSTAITQLVNSVKDMIAILDTSATQKILVDQLASVSLMEVCFNNGIEVSEIDRIYKLNTQLDDILDIPRFTVINL